LYKIIDNNSNNQNQQKRSQIKKDIYGNEMLDSELGLGRRKKVISKVTLPLIPRKSKRRSRVPPAVTKMMGEANMY
jgi:hypothetical protein